MGILSTIGTILPTVGNILGQLLTGIKAEDGTASSSIAYNFGDDITCGFKRYENGEIKLLNTSLDDNKVITFAVPAIGDMEAETMIVNSGNGVSVTDAFERCAAADSTQCMLSGSSVDVKLAASLGESSDVFHFAAGGKNIPVDGVTQKRIGSFLRVICHEDKAVFESAKTIKRITSANFYGCNDSAVLMSDLDAVPNATGTQVVVHFPTKFPAGTYLEIDVEADMGDRDKLVAEQRVKATKVSEEELRPLREAALAMRR